MNNQKRKLNNVTLIGADCVNLDRLILAMDICQKYFDFAQVKILTSLTSDNKNVIKINPLSSTQEYSHFVLNNLHKYVDTEFALVIQYDGFILNPNAWDDDYLHYDYIGAPWLISEWNVERSGTPVELVGKKIVGNGGFSLRSKKLLELSAQLMAQGKLGKYHAEDTAICIRYRKLFEDAGIKFAPVELASKFSYEAIDDLDISWDGEFGFHGLNWTDISKWTKAHPEYKIDNPAAKGQTPYHGDIIEESLEDKNVLKGLNILNTRVSKVTEKHQTPWLKEWHLHEVKLDGYRQAEPLAKKLSRALESEHSWYADFKNQSTHFIIFKNKVFRIDRTSYDQYKEASDYGISLGIPPYQVDFTKDVICKS